MKNNNINCGTTFRELKSMLPDATHVMTPKGKTLIRSDEDYLIRVKEGDATITVYKNGFFVYSDSNGNHTARAVWNCRIMKYPKAEGGFEAVKEDAFQEIPFPMVLAQFGMENMEDQKNKRDSYNFGISLDASEIQMEESLCVPDFTQSLDLDGDGDIWEMRLQRLPEALASLNQEQRTAFILRHKDGMTYEQIASVIGGDKASALRMVRRAQKNLKKYFESR